MYAKSTHLLPTEITCVNVQFSSACKGDIYKLAQIPKFIQLLVFGAFNNHVNKCP